MYTIAALVSLLVAAASAQQVGTLTPENHPPLPIQSCSPGQNGNNCAEIATTITLDANWRYLHSTQDSTNCYQNNTFNPSLCPDEKTCAQNCALDGADYQKTYGITVKGNSLTLTFVTNGNVGARLFLMDTDDTNYKLFQLKNREFTFDVDASQLVCGLNGAVYFVEMDSDGGLNRFPTNKAGSKYGTGYCDAQCPHDVKFIDGQANFGTHGTCCNEVDIWEANSVATALTPHPCSVTQQSICTDTGCDGICDAAGCDFNPYRLGNETFYGSANTINTNNAITVVTQFITSDNTDTGALTSINRWYVQNNVVIANSNSSVSGVPNQNSIDETWCTDQKIAFSDTNDFGNLGGLKTVDESMSRGQVLVLSLWADYAANMQWLDGVFPPNSNKFGSKRGSCDPTSGVPAQLIKDDPSAQVTYSNIKFGPIGSTFNAPTS